MLVLLYVGIHFYRKNNHREDYYVGNRSMSAGHVGLSIVATDVGGGFSIGLGGVGFLMGLSGSWLLFTGLIGAWFSAVFIIPRIKKIDSKHSMLTYPDFLRFRYGDRVALVAAVISGIGYLGFTSAQMLAGAKLASATIFRNPPMGMDPVQFSLIVIAGNHCYLYRFRRPQGSHLHRQHSVGRSSCRAYRGYNTRHSLFDRRVRLPEGLIAVRVFHPYQYIAGKVRQLARHYRPLSGLSE